jgi:hypothetical protein
MTAYDEILAMIRRLQLPERLRLIERAALDVAVDTPKPAPVAERQHTLGVDEFLSARLTPPPGVGSVSLQDMDRAIADGASQTGRRQARRLNALTPGRRARNVETGPRADAIVSAPL